MLKNNNPFDVFKKIPYFNEKLLNEITREGWFDTADILSRLGQIKRPLIDLVETSSEIIITAEVPGLRDTKDISVVLRGSTLQIEGEIVIEPYTLKEVKVHKQERQGGKFSRKVTLPVEVDDKSTRASYSHGILELRLAKSSCDRVKTLDVEFYK